MIQRNFWEHLICRLFHPYDYDEWEAVGFADWFRWVHCKKCGMSWRQYRW